MLAGAAGTDNDTSYPLGMAYTEHFAFEMLVEPSPALAALTRQADEVYRYVSARLGVSHSSRIGDRVGGRIGDRTKVTVEQRADEPCPARGVFIRNLGDGSPGLVIYADDTTGPGELLGILAHELGHSLHASGFGEFNSSAGLAEGLATWAAGRYWLQWHRTPSLAASVRAYRAQGSYLRLENRYGFREYRTSGEYRASGKYRGSGACLERRTRLYTEWAAFTDFLIRSYGVGEFKTLLASADIVIDPSGEMTGALPDYRATYGLTLRQLEALWLRRLGPG